MLANCYKDSFGLYLIKFNETDLSKNTFILKIKNGIEIGDADV